jgi:hypothetical protein
LVPNWKQFQDNLQQWDTLTTKHKSTIEDVEYFIEKAFFDRKGNFISLKENPFKKYLNTIQEIADYGTAEENKSGDGNIPIVVSSEKEPILGNPRVDTQLRKSMQRAFYYIKEEVENIRTKKKKEAKKSVFSQTGKAPAPASNEEGQEAPFRFALRKLKAYCEVVFNRYISTIIDARKNWLENDLKNLANAEMLTSDESWLKTAKRVMDTKKHHGLEVPDEVFKDYAPKIQKAIDIAQQRAA